MNITGTPGNDTLYNPGASGTLSVVVSGQSAEGLPPIIKLLVNGVAVTSNVSVTADHSLGATQTVSAVIPAGTNVTSVAIEYVNDTVSPEANAAGQDRNLYVTSVSLNGSSLEASSATYARTLNGEPFDQISGTFEMKWGGTQTFSGPAVTSAAASSSVATSDTVDGLAGLDALVYAGARAEYTIGHPSNWTVAHGAELDTVVNIERLQFSDMKHALDMDAGSGTVAKLIATLFGQSYLGIEEYAGAGIRLADQGLSALQIAEFAVNTSEFQQRAGSTSNEAFVNTVAANLGYTGETGGFLADLNAGNLTKAALAVMASEYVAANMGNYATLMGVMQTGIDYV